MQRLTKRIGSTVYYTNGQYEHTAPDEMRTDGISECLQKLADYEDKEEYGSKTDRENVGLEKAILEAIEALKGQRALNGENKSV